MNNVLRFNVNATNCMENVNSTPVTRRSAQGFTLLFISLFKFCSGLYLLGTSSQRVHSTSWVGVILVFSGLHFFRKWLRAGEGDWFLDWDQSHIQIHDGGNIAFEGDVSTLYRIEQDGRGYFLYSTRDAVFRLYRGKSSAEFERILDQHTQPVP